MPQHKDLKQNQSISVVGNVTDSSIFMGHNNTVSLQFRQASLPSIETVDIQHELKAIEEILLCFEDPIATGVAKKLAAQIENPEADQSTVARILETGLTYIQNLSGFVEKVDQLRPHIEATASWLGENGYKLLSLVGLTL